MKVDKLTIGSLAHVDAGKTTLSESILYLTGVTRTQGRVDHKNAFLDHDEIERNRGITVFAKEARFALGEKQAVLLDTPGHEDFSEDTYRVLTAVDSAVMVIDSAKGIETQTKKLFEVCRLRNIPIITFINNMDREGQDPFLLLDDIE